MNAGDFIADASLYASKDLASLQAFGGLGENPIHGFCQKCRKPQTFTPSREMRVSVENVPRVTVITYSCAACRIESRYFVFRYYGSSVEKIGQYPPNDISVDRDVESFLGDERTAIFKKGLICQSQGYGIGAFAYFRSILESIVVDLLREIGNLIKEQGGSQAPGFEQALDKTHASTQADEKISLVKDLLPDSLKPNNMNPLAIIYGALSGGIHSTDDQACLDLAEKIRMCLTYLIVKIYQNRDQAKQFTEGIQKILEKRKPKS